MFDVSENAEAAWVERIVTDWHDNRAFLAACTPSRLNFDGHPEAANPRSGTYGGGYGDVFAYQQLLKDWRAQADFAGLEIDEAAAASSQRHGGEHTPSSPATPPGNPRPL
jgi:hypothetical protein